MLLYIFNHICYYQQYTYATEELGHIMPFMKIRNDPGKTYALLEAHFNRTWDIAEKPEIIWGDNYTERKNMFFEAYKSMLVPADNE